MTRPSDDSPSAGVKFGKYLRVQVAGHLDHPSGDGLARVVLAGEVARHVAAAAVDAQRLDEVAHLDLELRHHQALQHGDRRALGDARLGRFLRARAGVAPAAAAASAPATTTARSAAGAPPGHRRASESGRALGYGRALMARVARDPPEARLALARRVRREILPVERQGQFQHAASGVLRALLVAGEVALDVAVVAFHADGFGHAAHLVADLSAVPAGEHLDVLERRQLARRLRRGGRGRGPARPPTRRRPTAPALTSSRPR